MHHCCHDQEIRQLVYFLRLFRPNELEFLLDIGRQWSHFDPDRIEKITILFNQTFQTDQAITGVQQKLTFSQRNPSLSFDYKLLINQLIDQQLNPFRSDCPVCGSSLHHNNASIHPVKLYSLKGQLIEDIRFDTMSRFYRYSSFQLVFFLSHVLMLEHVMLIIELYLFTRILFVRIMLTPGHQRV